MTAGTGSGGPAMPPGSTLEATAAVVAVLGDDLEDEITGGAIQLNPNLAQAGTAGILGWLERTRVFDGYLAAWLERDGTPSAWPAGTRAAALALLTAHRELTSAAVAGLLRRAGLLGVPGPDTCYRDGDRWIRKHDLHGGPHDGYGDPPAENDQVTSCHFGGTGTVTDVFEDISAGRELATVRLPSGRSRTYAACDLTQAEGAVTAGG